MGGKNRGICSSCYWLIATKKRMLVTLLAIVVISAIAISLAVTLTRENNSSPTPTAPAAPTSPTAPIPTPTGGNLTAKWQPKVGTSWQIELLYPLNDTSVNAEVYDIDLWINNASMITQLHGEGRRVICYFSAGSYENWRPDANQFQPSDLGKELAGWANEKWLNIKSPNVRQIMVSRLQMAQEKGCDGVDPDNVDGYDNDNGLGLTKADSINYVNFLAIETHARNMSIGLKNAGDIIPSVINNMQWSVNEQCVQYDECDTYAAFTAADKPVFHIEYPKGDTSNNSPITTLQKTTACSSQSVANFSTVIKNLDLDNWIQTC
jgi:hypothetical protein